MDMYSDKKRGLDLTDVGKESFIHWNGPPIHMCTELGDATLDLRFGGRKWHFVKNKSRSLFNDSSVVHRLKQKLPRVPFFQD